jgi:HSP20 family molecular chaperone IbpA
VLKEATPLRTTEDTVESRSQNDRSGRDAVRDGNSALSANSFMLPSDVREDGTEAAYKDGVLSVTIPKSERVKEKKIS